MIVCDEFAVLHLHKSGGSFVNRLMLTCLPSARRIGYHLPYSQIPDDARALPVVGTVRNPWAYYVSWYHFQRAQARPNALFLTCSEAGALGFADTIRNLIGLQNDSRRVDRLVAAFPADFQQSGLNLTKACIAPILGSGLGFYSFLYERLFAGAAQPRILMAEHLRDDLGAFLGATRAQSNDRTRAYLAANPRVNASRHGPYQDYYDQDLRTLVATLDDRVIAAHGYSF